MELKTYQTLLDTDTVRDPLTVIDDAAEKVEYLINDIKSEYAFRYDQEPSHDVLERFYTAVKEGKRFHDDSILANCERWICHYHSIMLRVDMLEDYMIILRKHIEAAGTALDTLDE